MRNLKRVLSLALASAMLLGMMVMGAGAVDAKKTAADLTDSSKITNKEAVTLLVDLGIIEGKTDGSYAPAEVVNRATMAKLITVMMMGNVDQNLFKGTATDLNDINGHWAEGYIKFCYSNKIISGDGLGSFFPDQPVTTVQAAKMLLVAIGYDAKDRGYEGTTNWSVNIMKDAQTTSVSATQLRALTSGVSASSTDGLTRDNAAQMIFNTLFVRTWEPEYAFDMGVKYISKYNPAATMASTAYNGLYSVSGTLDSVDGSGYGAAAALTKSDNTSGGALTTGNKIKASAADVGSPVVLYKNAVGFVSTAAVSATAKTLATSNNGTPWSTSLTKRGEKGYIGVDADDTVVLYVNGTKKTTDTHAVSPAVANDGIYYPTTADKTAMDLIGDANTGIGQIVEFFDNDNDGKYDVVKFTTYTLSQVSKVTAAKADGTEATVTLKGYNNGAAIAESLIVGDFASLTKDTYVMVAKIGSQFYTYAPTTVTGTMSKYNTSTKSMTVDGTVHTASILPNGLGYTQAQAFNGTTESVFYMDKNGYVVAVDGVAAADKYVIVDAIAFVPGSGTEISGYAEARLIFDDGSKQTVKVNKLGTNPVTQSATSGTVDGAYATGTVANLTADNDTDLANCIYTYVNNDGKYALTRKAEDATAQITKGSPVVDSEIANDNTIFVYKIGTAPTFTYTAYTGYKNAPSTKDATAVVTVVAKGGYAKLVFVTTTAAKVTGDVGNVVMFLSDDYSVDNADPTAPLYEYNAIVNGTQGSYSSKNLLTGIAVGTLYNVVTDSKGYISSPAADGANFGDSAASTATTYYPTVAMADATNGAVKTAGNFAATSNPVASYNGDETVYLVNLADKTINEGTMADITAGTYFVAKVAGATGALAGTVSVVYALVGAGDAPVAVSALAVTAPSGTVGDGNLLDGAAAITGSAADETVIVTPTVTSGTHAIITIDGAGTDVTATDGPATYTLVAGDIGATLVVTVTSYASGKLPSVTVYSITVAA